MAVHQAEVETAWLRPPLGYVRALGQTAFGVLMFYLGLQAMNVMTWVGFYDVVDGNLSIGKLSAFTSYIWTLGMAVAGVVKQVIEVNTMGEHLIEECENCETDPAKVERMNRDIDENR